MRGRRGNLNADSGQEDANGKTDRGLTGQTELTETEASLRSQNLTGLVELETWSPWIELAGIAVSEVADEI